MKTYEFYTFGGNNANVKIVRSPNQFNWLGFWFPWIYTGIKQLWIYAIVTFSIIVVTSLFWDAIAITPPIDPSSTLVCNVIQAITNIVVGIVVGKKVNGWIASKLQLTGYKKADTISAPNKDAALAQFFQN